MAKVIHGDADGNQINVSADKAQAYGLAGNDTILSDNKSNVLIVGGSGDDILIVMGGDATLSGGAGANVFELNYSSEKKLSAVIEDLDPSSDKIFVKVDGKTAPQLSSIKNGKDVVWSDGDGNFNLTLKSVRENDYFDGDARDESWKVLEFTNAEREAENLSPFTMSQGLMTGAQIRAEEIKILGEGGALTDHTRPNGEPYYKVPVDGNLTLQEKYLGYGENLDGGADTPEEVVKQWMGSTAHRKNILKERFKKLGVGYVEDHYDLNEYYWTQEFADRVQSPETVGTAELLTTNIESYTISKFITGNNNANTIKNADYGVTIAALGGNDSVNNAGLNVSISGGRDDDIIDNSGSFVTVVGDKGNDQINLSDDAKEILIQYNSGDGSDSVSGLNSTDTLSISGSEFTPATVNNDIIVGVGSDSITLFGSASSGVQIAGTRSKFIIGTENADNLDNSAAAATILAKGGDDYIYNDGSNVSINAGADNDYITNNGENVTIDASTGNDYITNNGKNVLFFHESGNDTIGGFDETSTLKIAGGSYSSFASSNDLILISSTDSIKILGAINLDSVNIFDSNDNPFEIGDAKDIRGTEQADSLKNAINGATIQSFGGDDTITNSGENISIYGGVGNDYVNNNNRRRTIYFYESGSDTIEGFTDSDTLDIGDYAWETVESGADIIFNIISNSETIGAITLKDYHSDQEPNVISTYEPPSVPGEKINNTLDSTFISGTANDDTITNYSGYKVTITALAGNDSVDNHGNSALVEGGVGNDTLYNYVSANTDDANYSTIRGEAGNDFIDNHGNHALIEGGTGNDTIHNYSGAWRDDEAEYSTLLGGDGNDYIDNTGSNVTINGGAGNDSIKNYASDVTIDGGDGNDSIENDGSQVTISGSAGDDFFYNLGDGVSIDGDIGDDYIDSFGSSYSLLNGGAGKDYIMNGWNGVGNNGNNSTVLGGAGDDYIINGSAYVTVDGGDGNDLIRNFSDEGGENGEYNSINGGNGNDFIVNSIPNSTILGAAGNDTIENGKLAGSTGVNVTILAGTGDDEINLLTDSRNNFIAYTAGDGNDTIWGISATDSISIAGRKYDTRYDHNDLIIEVGSGSITLKDARNKPLPIIIGESGSSGGTSNSGSGNGGNSSSSGNSGSSGNGNSGGSSSGGTSSSEGRGSDASGGRSASGSSGTSATAGISSGSGNSSTLPSATQSTYTNKNLALIQNSKTPTFETLPDFTQENFSTPDDSANNKKIIFNPTNYANSPSAQEVVNLMQNINPVINGSDGPDLIYSDEDGAQFWGGNGFLVSDTLVGGAGTDIFIGGKNEGSDIFLNVSSSDIVYLSDVTFNDLADVNKESDMITFTFKTGNSVNIQSSESVSGAVVLADSTWHFRHAT